MVGQGFVQSLVKPGGNTTGVTIVAFELDGKRQEILTETIPGLRRIGALSDTNMARASHLQAIEAAARAASHSRSIR
jgi:putative ABC transport system substrate-binding protein